MNGSYKNGVSSTVAPWVVAALGVAGFMWSQINQTAGKADLTALEARVREDLRHSEETADKQVGVLKGTILGEISQIKHDMGERETLAQHKEFADRMTDQASVFREDIKGVRTEVVDRVGVVREAIAEVRKDVLAIAPPADRLKAMETRIEAVQNRLDQISHQGVIPLAPQQPK
jgi:hypothetical protein